MHLLCINMFYIILIFEKYLHVITSIIIYVITCIITLKTHPLNLNPPLNLPIPPNLYITKSVLGYTLF